MQKSRVEGFSDGVFAVALTLLILGIHVPTIFNHSNLATYLNVMVPLIPSIISFILSFAIISIHWVSHHFFFQHLKSAPLGIIWLNNLFLLWICFMPLPTAILGEHPTDQFPLILFGINQLLAAITFFALRMYASRESLFVGDKESQKAFGPRHSLPAIAIYFTATLFAFVNVYLSIASLLLAPLLYFVPNLLRLD